MSGFTPGPWKLGKQSSQEVDIDSDAEPRLGYAYWTGLATVYGCDDDRSIGEEVMLANARLIAAAPELYEFARYVLDMDPESDAPLFAKARAALAKAGAKCA